MQYTPSKPRIRQRLEPIRVCLHCRSSISRKLSPSGTVLEKYRDYVNRKYCCQPCQLLALNQEKRCKSQS
jgi:hypothetical protein